MTLNTYVRIHLTIFCISRSKVQSPATELLSRSETRRRPPPFQQPQDQQDQNRRIDYDAYSDYDYNDFDSEIPYLLNQCKTRNNRKNAGKSLMKNTESMPKFEHFPMKSGQILSSGGLESRLSDLDLPSDEECQKLIQLVNSQKEKEAAFQSQLISDKSNNGNFGGRVNPNQERVSVKKKPQIQTASTPMPLLTKTFRNPTNRPVIYSTTRKSTSR